METNPSLEQRNNLEQTIDGINFILTLITNLVDKFDRHSQDDIKDVIFFLLRELSSLEFNLL